MFNHNELNFNELHDKMSKKFQEKTLIINQPIHIRDIFIYSANSAQSHGEAVENSNKYKDYTTLSRLADHIESLALLGNKYHLKYNCNIKSDGTYSIKPDCLNKVTRILLHEDTLYTTRQ